MGCSLRALSRSETLQKMGACHVLAHPSLHDSGGFVCSEMMAVGRPVLCLDLGGPATQITGETGIKVPAPDPDRAVRGLAEAMIGQAGDPVLRQRMGEAGQQRVREVFDWDFWLGNCQAGRHKKTLIEKPGFLKKPGF